MLTEPCSPLQKSWEPIDVEEASGLFPNELLVLRFLRRRLKQKELTPSMASRPMPTLAESLGAHAGSP